VILESQHYNIYEINKIKSQNEKVVAYISLGEINAHSKYFEHLKENTFGKNEIWNSYYLNLKSDHTIEKIMEMVNNTLDLGYDGLFFDNIDNFTSFGPQSQQKEDLLKLLKTIDNDYSDHVFIQNAGIQIISETAQYVDAIVVESVASNYTFDDKNYKLRDLTEFENAISELEKVRKKYNLPLILVEYADNMELHNAILKRINASKFDCFIGNIDLQTMPKFSN
jgi:endo-alpha-1,4-polygalactosaminidase (GH114 family)